ncbi:helix-turn-helix domain-containing protein [Paenibacillus taichungensis]|uniref:helix-turn-helix domain-containing protein n=1 Tax=Paenibacillus taichungensis TaxID=484184 RepID=UPI0038D1F4BF
MDITRTEEFHPPVLTPKDIQNFLGISKSKTYEFLNSGELHVARAGRTIYVSRVVFLEWLEGKSD